MNAEHRKVVSIGGDAELLWLRHAVLQTAGFDVLTTESEADALASIRRGECRVLLVCYSLSLGVRRRLAEAFRSHCPYGKILAITNTQLDKPEFADSFVYGLEGPEVLIQSIHNS
jgi:hypothetical protein